MEKSWCDALIIELGKEAEHCFGEHFQVFSLQYSHTGQESSSKLHPMKCEMLIRATVVERCSVNLYQIYISLAHC